MRKSHQSGHRTGGCIGSYIGSTMHGTETTAKSNSRSPQRPGHTRSSSASYGTSKFLRKKTNKTSTLSNAHYEVGSAVVQLVPQSVEYARSWNDLWLTYRGYMFRGDQLLELRTSILNRMISKMQTNYPLNDRKINILLHNVLESHIGKLQVCRHH